MKDAGDAAQSLCLSMRVTLFEGRKVDGARHVFGHTRFAQFRVVRSLGRSPPPRNKIMSYPCKARTLLYWYGLRAAITRSYWEKFSGQGHPRAIRRPSNLSCNSEVL
jgi:hypothetical protein